MTVHIVLNSHLDPIWLWNLEQGIDAALASARTACDILDEYPETHVTRGEAWYYETVARHDPATFRRMLAHVAAGRLHPVGGWFVQPDCNLAAPETYRLHAALAMPYFRDVLGARVKTGYNVDSFGHGAFLPDFYTAAGIENYIFMRPQAHEKHLPGDIFRWRSPSGAELLAARIRESYCSDPATIADRMAKAAAQDDGGTGHSLFFCGVGDHGGGPTREEVRYLIAHRDDFPGVEFRFSHPDAFFDAVRADGAAFSRLPVVEGELQHHAIGCYSAYSPVKRSLRAAEDLFHRSGRLLPKRRREESAKELLFATFHDVLAGTCIQSAYPSILDRLGAVRTSVENAEIAAVRRRNAALPRIAAQRVIIDNFGSEPYRGMVEFEPWLSGLPADAISGMRLRDQTGADVPFQSIPVESLAHISPRIAFPVRVGSRDRRILTIELPPRGQGLGKTPPSAPGEQLDAKAAFDKAASLVSFDVLDDLTDTWSHGPKGYAQTVSRSLTLAGPPSVAFSGPLLSEALSTFADGFGNTVLAAVRAEAGLEGFRLRLRVTWIRPREILKLSVKPPFRVVRRFDSVSGGEHERALDGEEYPIRRAVRLEGEDGRSFALVTDDAFACDVQPDGTLRLTLLRTPYFAHHAPTAVPDCTMAPVADIGVHDFSFAFLENPTARDISEEVFALTRPLRFSETTGASDL